MSLFPGIANASALIVGASRGIGLGFVRRLLQEPALKMLFVTYRRPDSAAALLALADQFPRRLHCLPMDITDEAQIATAIAKIQTTTQRLHLVINCVGFLHDGAQQPEKSLRQIQAEPLLRYFQVNSVGAILLAKLLLPLLNHSERSRFATLSAKIGSIEDNRLGGWYGYRASKAALNMLLKTAAIEYRRKSPQTLVVMLHPGTTDTQLSQPFQRNLPPEQLFSVERTVEQLIEVLQNLEATDSGAFFSWDGSRLPW
ncbi:SDR family NAD(P)-dependent oxidoreductase [Romeria aff. gracilis LEGE 07310]|uniref:SDR family NAD(P)-dependent oxidoreductase n=1 Tax=Vasconcelosia minhoensis LEGE 07310 TaxID=915328 RepID=A0A8J7DBI2_9CYAN|nr:SDR family NAD(P)-dependent oxidoreductase [Romeria gracilis]MBE9076433.1 SDR family NAD(P)-dependent oxidoreductase [Romeria aff. gracilis LEGE 07310]